MFVKLTKKEVTKSLEGAEHDEGTEGAEGAESAGGAEGAEGVLFRPFLVREPFWNHSGAVQDPFGNAVHLRILADN